MLELGVKESFDVSDLTSFLRDLRCTYQDEPLPHEKIEMCVSIVKIVARLLDPLISTETDSSSNSNGIITEVAPEEDVVGTSVTDEVDNSKIKAEKIAGAKASLGKIYLPDRNSVMADGK
jgi:hypothetical protein